MKSFYVTLGFTKIVFCFKNCFNLPREKKSGDREHFFRLLELYIQTVKGENNYETKYFLNRLLEVIRYTLEQLKNQLKP